MKYIYLIEIINNDKSKVLIGTSENLENAKIKKEELQNIKDNKNKEITITKTIDQFYYLLELSKASKRIKKVRNKERLKRLKKPMRYRKSKVIIFENGQQHLRIYNQSYAKMIDVLKDETNLKYKYI